jgi:protein TonB
MQAIRYFVVTGFLLFLTLAFPNAECAENSSVESAEPTSLQKNTGALVTSSPQYILDAKNCIEPDYPSVAMYLDLQGSVTVSLLVDVNGKVKKGRIEKSSGWKILDNAALNALSACPFRLGKGESRHEPAWVRIQHEWKLESPRIFSTVPVLLAEPCLTSSQFKVVPEGVSGEDILFRAMVGENGEIRGTLLLEKSSGKKSIDQAAIALLKSCRFVPGIRDGKPAFGPVTMRFLSYPIDHGDGNGANEITQ